MNRLQFKHVSQLFPSREAAIQFIESSKIDVDKPFRAALFAEPVVLRYGESGAQHIIVAIGVNEVENVFEYIDYYGTIEELNNIKEGVSAEMVELLAKIDALTFDVNNNKTSIDELSTALNNVYTKSEVNSRLDTKASSNNLSALSARVDVVESDIDNLELDINNKLGSISSANNAIEVGGTATAPTIGLKIDDTASAGNVMLEVTAEGLKASANITQFQTIVVDALPAEGSSLYYYLVKTATEDLYNEYVWSEVSTGVFEFVFLGDTSVDLSDYVTNEELTAALTLKANVTTTDAIATRIDGMEVELDSKLTGVVGAVANAIKVDSTLPSTPSVYLSLDVDKPGNVSLSQNTGSLSANIDLSSIETSISDIEVELDDKVNTIIAVDGVSVNTIADVNNHKIYNVGVKVNKNDGNVVITNSNEGISANIDLPQQFIDKINETDKILTVGADNDIRGIVNLYYESSSKILYLYGKDNIVISEVDASAFFADAFIDSATYEPSTKELIFIINKSDGTTESLIIDMSELADTYFGGEGIEVDGSNNINIKLDDTTENYISVSPEGLKVSGIITSIDDKVKVETDRALMVENQLRVDVNNKVAALISTTDAIEVDNSTPTNPTIDLIVDESSSKGNVDLTITGNGLRGNIPLGVGLKLNPEKQLTVNFAGDLTLNENGALVLDTGNVSDLTNYYTKTDVDSKLTIVNNEIDDIDGAVTTLQAKLNTIAEGAEVNVRADWNVNDPNSDAYIFNKPTIPSVNGLVSNEALAIALSGKADTSVTDGIDVRLVAAEGEIDVLQNTISGKADTSVTDGINVRLVAAEGEIDALQSAVNNKANSVDVYTKAEVDTALGNKTDTSVTDGINVRLVAAEGEIDALQSAVNNKVSGVISGNAAISVGGTTVSPLIGLKIDTTATAGNVLLEVTDEGLKASANISQFHTKVVSELPSTGESLVYYLIEEPSNPGVYDQYVWAEVEVGVFEFVSLGSSSVDLSEYVTNDDMNSALALKANVSELTPLQTKVGGIESGAEVNVIEGVQINGVDLVVDSNRKVNVLVPSVSGLASEEYVNTEITTKQDVLVSGSTIKTVNGESILGSGNIVLQSGGGDVQSVNGKQGVVVIVANDIADVYSKTEVDNTISGKADTSVTDGINVRLVAAEGEIDALQSAVNDKANSADVYTKAEVNTALGDKADTSVTDGLGVRLVTAEGEIDALQSAVNDKANTSVTDGINARLVTTEEKLDDIDSNAQVNVIEVVQVNGTPLSVNSKTVNVDLTPYQLKTGFETITDNTTILPNIYYTVAGSINSLELTLGGTQLNNEYIFRFTVSDSPGDLTIVGASITGIKPLKASKTYEVSILNGLALMAEI